MAGHGERREAADHGRAGRWPAAELTVLAGYARAQVLRQASDEESLLFPAVPAVVAGLARDHVGCGLLPSCWPRPRPGNSPCPSTRSPLLSATSSTQLERHLRNEEDLLGVGPRAAGRAGHRGLRRALHEWGSRSTEGPWSTLMCFPEPGGLPRPWTGSCCGCPTGEQGRTAVRLGPGPGGQELSGISPDGYRFDRSEDGPDRRPDAESPATGGQPTPAKPWRLPRAARMIGRA